MRWLLASAKTADQRYAERVLASLAHATAMVPNLWHLEAANVMLGAMEQGRLERFDLERFATQLNSLPITTDELTAAQAFGNTFSLASAYKLSSYDGAYLELCLRLSLPMATLDKSLIRACKKTGVALYLGEL
jgi:predicted nucleic acid-binding protein